MASWEQIATENYRAAKLLHDQGLYRASVNRSYYAAYSLITKELVATGAAFARGWNNPAHEQLPQLILFTCPFDESIRRGVARTVRTLRHAREDADYRPGQTVDRKRSREALLELAWLFRALGAELDGA